jgi:hypothetical protein
VKTADQLAEKVRGYRSTSPQVWEAEGAPALNELVRRAAALDDVAHGRYIVQGETVYVEAGKQYAADVLSESA